ncbi:MAG: PQQ-binding-like beta-propeller repeat protein [Verrucomicrobiae bacterium]|nr:PQQ-binding-like beta-propeller repeat protein [Verrucomicrobiae bacterium]
MLSGLPFVNPAPSLALAFAWTFSASPAGAEDWPNLRGPNHNGMSTETGWKSSGEFPVAWKAEVGLGHSAIVVAGGKAYTLGHNGKDTDTLWCFNAETGAEIWKHSYPHPLDDLYFPGGTTGTPTVDGDVVYSVARRGQLFCLDAKTGSVKWQKHLTDDFGCKMPDWGFTGAPRVYGDLLLLNAGESGLALKKSDGSLVWQSDEKTAAGYSVPQLFEREGKDLALFSNKDGYTCVDPTNGEVKWFYKHKTRYGVNATEPIVIGDQLFIATGYGKGAALLNWGGTGDPEEIWRSRDLANQMNPSLLIDGFLYGIHGDEGKDGSGLKCLVMASGETKWLDESVAHGAATAADGKLIVITESGELQIGAASPDGFKPTFKQSVLSPKCWTIPVLANGRIYCRNSKGEIAVLDAR